MNNKKLGSCFEREFCRILAAEGFWVHFIAPDARGAQPFDVVAAKGGTAYAFDCKTCVAKYFDMSRMEDNQKTSFALWMKCGNGDPWVAVKHQEEVYLLRYADLLKKGKMDIAKEGIKYDKDKGFGGLFD